ncbi:hypothetical protein [Amycolatopsis sp. NPDC054798]
MSANVVSELQELALHRPSVDAADCVVAAWYEEKAVVLRDLGLTGDAVAADAHARKLRVRFWAADAVEAA